MDKILFSFNFVKVKKKRMERNNNTVNLSQNISVKGKRILDKTSALYNMNLMK